LSDDQQIEADVRRILALPHDEQVEVIVSMIKTLPPDRRAQMIADMRESGAKLRARAIAKRLRMRRDW
jgi:hypothetical protein